jgi:hypothetical protein
VIGRLLDHFARQREHGRFRRAAESCRATAPIRGYGRIDIDPRYPPHEPYIPFKVGNVTIDLQPKAHETMHVVVGGTTRLGKSTAVLPLFNLPIGVLVIALDNTRPIANYINGLPDGIEWVNEPNWPVAWNMLTGDPRLVAEAVSAGWPRSDRETEHYRRIARARIIQRIVQADLDGEVRSIPMLINALSMPSGSKDPMIDRASRHWATKLANMYDVLGSGIGGPGDLDLLSAMRDGKKVLMRLNRYLHPEDTPTLGGMLLVHARRVAQECGTPFILIVEEAGVLGDHEEQIIPLAQAAADRGVPTVLITQNMSKLRVEIANNISVWVSFAQEAKPELQFAAHHLRLDPDQLKRESFPGEAEQQGRGWCFVRAPGMRTHLVHINPIMTTPMRVEQEPVLIPTQQPSRYVMQEFIELDGWHHDPLALPPPRPTGKPLPPDWVGFDKDLLRWYNNMTRTNRSTPLWSPERGVWWDSKGCLEWGGPYSKHRGDTAIGRPRSNRGRTSVTVYIETAKAAGRSTEPTWDHCCDNPICCDPEHGYGTTITENNANRPIRDAMLRHAWMDRYGQIPQWWEDRDKPR